MVEQLVGSALFVFKAFAGSHRAVRDSVASISADEVETALYKLVEQLPRRKSGIKVDEEPFRSFWSFATLLGQF